MLPLVGERKAVLIVRTEGNTVQPAVSPDGRWLAYQSDESHRPEIYITPFPGGGAKWQVSTTGGFAPRWRADGKELFYVARDGHLMATPIAVTADGQALTPGAPVSLFLVRLASGTTATLGTYSGRPQYAVARDGRFLVNLAVDAEATPPIAIVLNWDAQLRE